jgi:hypothetical protein
MDSATMRKFATAEDDDDLLPDDYPSDSDSYVLGKPTLDLAALMWQPSYRGGLLPQTSFRNHPSRNQSRSPQTKGLNPNRSLAVNLEVVSYRRMAHLLCCRRASLLNGIQ